MASGSLKVLSNILIATFSNPILLPKPAGPSKNIISPRSDSLPKDTHTAISAFLEKHAKVDDSESQKLHDELLSIHKTYVVPDTSKMGAFLQSLYLLKPAITGQVRTEEWWRLAIRPVLDGVGHKRVEVEHATSWVLDVLENGSNETSEEGRTRTSAAVANMLLHAFLKRTDPSSSEKERSTAEDDFVARQLEAILEAYGCKRPKAFLLAIDRLFVQRQHRLQALGLMCTFVKHQPLNLYSVTQTPVIEHLIKCLMIDTSTTAITLALTTLIMFLPHIPSSVRTHLPRLFLIYSRLLCWEQQRPTLLDQTAARDSDIDSPKSDDEQVLPTEDEGWEKLQSSFDAAESTAPELLHFFTFLYGLYPLNFTSYIHKPRKYLKGIEFPRAADFDLDQNFIRKKSEQFRRVHLLHSNFFTTTLEDELKDDRWLKTDPPDVVSECMGLCIATYEPLQQSSPPPTARLPELPRQTHDDDDDGSSRPDHFATTTRDDSIPATPSTIGSPLSSMQDDDADSPTIPNFPPMTRNEAVSQPPSSVVSPSLGPLSRAQMPRSPALRPALPHEANMAHLQREVILLRSDLNFERYLKQQHLSHIGQLQRRTIKEATIEAETQNLINNNRSLKAQVSKANELYASLKKETATGRSQSRRLESDLSTKVRSLKEDEKQWLAEGETLRVELSKAQKDCDHLRQLVVNSESKELLARQELQFAEVRLEQLDTVKKRITELEESVRRYQSRELEFMQAKDERATLQQEIDTANLMVRSREASAERAARNFNRRIQELEAQVQSAQNPVAGGSPGQYSPQVQTVIESSISGLNAKYTALKKEHAGLRHQYVELDMKCQELQDALDAVENSQAPLRQRPVSSSMTGSSVQIGQTQAYEENVLQNQTHYSSAPTQTSGALSTLSAASQVPQRPTTSPSLQESLNSVHGDGSSTNLRDGPSGSQYSKKASRGPMRDVSALLRDSSPVGSLQVKDLGQQHPSTNVTSTTKFDTDSMVSRWSLDSWDEASTSGKSGKEKVGVKDQARVKGRGGTQNVGKKKEDVEPAGGSLSSVSKKKGLSGLLGRG